MQSEGEQEDGVKIGECVGADSGSDTRKRVHTMYLSVSTETNIRRVSMFNQIKSRLIRNEFDFQGET